MKRIWLAALFLLHQFCLFSLCKMFYRPRDDLRSELIHLIEQERQYICCAVYMISDKAIAKALVDAYVRGVRVQVIVDQLSMGEKFGKGQYLQEAGIPLQCHTAQAINAFVKPIMHHKFFIFGKNIEYGKTLVWTGSYNCSASASIFHDENALLIDDAEAIKDYQQCFAQLWKKLREKRSSPSAEDDFFEESAQQ